MHVPSLTIAHCILFVNLPEYLLCDSKEIPNCIVELGNTCILISFTISLAQYIVAYFMIVVN